MSLQKYYVEADCISPDDRYSHYVEVYLKNLVDALIAEKDQRIAKLEEALTECFEVCEYCRPHAEEALKP